MHTAWTESLRSNFTVQDVVGSLVAVVGFVAVLYAPGYLLAWAVDLFGFRSKGIEERSCWAVVCSFGVMPIVGYFVGRVVGVGALAAMLMGVVAVVAYLRWREKAGDRLSTRHAWWLTALGVAWVGFVVMSLVDLQVGKKLYFSVVLFDQSYRVAFTDAVARGGVPPANPLYFAGHAGAMRYYYFWYVICATVMRVVGVSARQAFVASSVWAGFGLVATIALYMRYFFGVVEGVRRQTLVAVGLLLVTGADLLPAIGSLFAQRAVNGEMEWWSQDQISSWMDSLLWVPHHVAALVCCLLSFLLLWRTREGLSGRQRWLAVGLAGVAFASAFGLSVYVAFGFGLLMVAWVLRGVLRGRREIGCVVAAGFVGAVLLVPFLRELLAGGGAGGGAAVRVFSLSVRRMIDPALVTGLPVFAGWDAAHPVLLDQTMRLVLLLPGLALELGFYVAVIWVVRKRRVLRARREEALSTALYLAVCGLVMVVFVRSSVISNNDFGYRAALLPQFFLLLLGARVVGAWWFGGGDVGVVATKARRRVLVGLMVLGVAGTVYQAGMLRVFLPVEAARAGSGFEALPGDALEAREAFAALNRVAPKSAVVQFNAVDPTVDRNGDVVPPYQFYSRALLMDSGRQVLNAEPECATEFGGDARACAAIRAATTQMYGVSAPSAEWAAGYCSRYGVGYLVASHWDPAWGDKAGWVWSLPVVAAEPGFRILKCAV